MQLTIMFPYTSTKSCCMLGNLTNIHHLPYKTPSFTTNNHSRYLSPNFTCKILINPSKDTSTLVSPPFKRPHPPLKQPTQTETLPEDYHSTLSPLQKLVASALDVVEKSLVEHEKKQPLSKTVDPAVQLAGNYYPVPESPVQTGLELIGSIPVGLQGIYLRNGANPMITPSRAHHLFDGDGMIHAITLGPGNKASYCCRFTRTNRLLQETKFGKNVYPKPVGELHGRTGLVRLGLFYARVAIGLIDMTRGVGVANAGLIYFNGRLFAMSEDDLPYHVNIIQNNDGNYDNNVGDLKTIGRFDFDGQVNRPLIAHPKIDPTTGDLHTLSYDVVRKPHLMYFRFNKWGRKTREVPVPLPQPTMIHDFAMTHNFVIIPDNQVVFQLSELIRNKSPLRFDPNKVARFGLLSKDDLDGSNIRWIDVPNSFCFHFTNAWEETTNSGGKQVVIIGSCMSPPDNIFNEKDEPIRIELSEFRIDLETGVSTRRVIVLGMNLEMGQVNKHMLGHKTRYVYTAVAEPWPKCSGIAKVDLETGKVTKFMYGNERYGGEPCFITAWKPSTLNNDSDRVIDRKYVLENEDEGWLVNFVRDEKEETSELVILRAKDMKQIASVCIPSRVPYGFHGTFVDHDELSAQRT